MQYYRRLLSQQFFSKGRTQSLLDKLAAEIQGRGGQCVTAQVDHSNDAEVKGLFEKIEKDNKGKLDVLVNNAFAAVNAIFENSGKPFWTIDPAPMWDIVNNVGLRNHYLCTTYAARLVIILRAMVIFLETAVNGAELLKPNL